VSLENTSDKGAATFLLHVAGFQDSRVSVVFFPVRLLESISLESLIP